MILINHDYQYLNINPDLLDPNLDHVLDKNKDQDQEDPDLDIDIDLDKVIDLDQDPDVDTDLDLDKVIDLDLDIDIDLDKVIDPDLDLFFLWFNKKAIIFVLSLMNASNNPYR